MVVDRFTIGTRKAFANNYAYEYQRVQIGSEWIYVCNKGSEWARRNEILLLLPDGGVWTAFDGCLGSDGKTFYCRQPVFRCLNEDITRAGDHVWQTNQAASQNGNGFPVRWDGELRAETRVP